jgi:hypothetical protein
MSIALTLLILVALFSRSWVGDFVRCVMLAIGCVMLFAALIACILFIETVTRIT